MNLGENNRVDHFAVCHSAGCYTHANPVNPVIVSSTQVSSFQFQVSSTYSWVDSLWTETVTRVHEDEPDPVPMQTTRRSTVHGRAGNRLAERTELMTAPGVWEQIDGVAYEYDVNGRETKRTAFNGLTTTSAWSGTCCGKSSETAPDGTRTTFTYDTAGRLVVRTVLDPVPIETHISYDALGRQTVTWTTNRVAQLGTPVLRTAYDPLGRVVSSADELGNTTTYVYSSDERTTTVTQPTGATQTTVTDEARRVVSLSGTATAPRTYTYGVNADGTQWTKVHHGADATAPAWTKTTHDLLGRTIREEKPGYGNTLLATTYTYDNGGRLLSQTQTDATDPVNLVIISKTLNKYNLYGDRAFTALDVNNSGAIDFAGADRVTGFESNYILKDGCIWLATSKFLYPDVNDDRSVIAGTTRKKLTGLNGHVAYSELVNMKGVVVVKTLVINHGVGETCSSVVAPFSQQAEIEVNHHGLLMKTVSTSAFTNQYAYDALNRRVAETDGRGNTTTTTYNDLGQVVTTAQIGSSNPANPVILSSTSYVYDNYGRQVETIDALNQSTHTVYDLRGSVVKQYGATYPVWYEYDTEGRMVAMATTRDTALDPATVDSFDHPSLDVTRWVYDPATGLLVQKLYDDGKGPSYTYTPDGKPATRTWARGVVTSYEYDVLGSLLSVNYSDATPDVSYTYDRLGRQLSAIVAGVSTNLYAYSTNTLDLISETQNGVVIARTNDTLGRAAGFSVAGVGDPGSPYAVTYAYDAYGRFESVASGGSTFSYSYLPGVRLVSGMTASTGHAWTRSYDPHRNFITAVTNSFNGNLISAFDYANDAIGRRTARLDSQPAGVAITNAFGYNARSEVTTAAMGTNTYGYVFDPIGNRITATNNAEVASYTSNGLNQYTNIVNAVVALPTYDDDGNMTSSGDGWHYVWNGENRLILASNETALLSYAYDHQGRMVWKKVSHGGGEAQSWEEGKAVSYLWDNYNIIAETSEENEISNTTYNIWGLDINGTLQGAGGVGGLLAVVKDNATVYFTCYDGNGNITEYVSINGTITAHREYDPFGGTVFASVDANAFTHWFSTKPWCSLMAHSEYQYRKYYPVLGRWLNRDPIEEFGGRSLYAFGNNRYGASDLLGLYVCNCGDMMTKIVDRGPKQTCYESWTVGYSELSPLNVGVATGGGAFGGAYSIIMQSSPVGLISVVLGLIALEVDVQPFVQSVTIQATGHTYRQSICQDYECMPDDYWIHIGHKSGIWRKAGKTYSCLSNHHTFNYTQTHTDLVWCIVDGQALVNTAGKPTKCFGASLEADYPENNPMPCGNSINSPGLHYSPWNE